MERIELCCHSSLDSEGSMLAIKDIVDIAKQYGVVGITDYCNIMAWARILNEKKRFAKDSKVILGFEAPVRFNNGIHRVVMLAKDACGKNIIHRYAMEIHDSDDFIEDEDMLAEANREGILLGGYEEIYAAISDGADDDDVLEILGGDYDFLLLDVEEDESINKKIVRLGEKLDIPVVATCRPYYLNEQDRVANDVLRCANGKCVDAKNRQMLTTDQMLEKLSYLTKEEAYKVVVINSNYIADLCLEFDLFRSEKFYPKLENQNERLRKLCYENAKVIYKEDTLSEAVTERIEWELKAIEKTGMAFAFLQTKEWLDKMRLKTSEISGRGVWMNSLVAHLCGISEIDPLKYDLSPYFIYGYEGKREIDININVQSDRIEEAHECVKGLEGNKTTLTAGVYGTYGKSHILNGIKLYEDKYKRIFLDDEKEYITEKIIKMCRKRGVNKACKVFIPENMNIPEDMPTSKLYDDTLTYYDYHEIGDYFHEQYYMAHDGVMLLNKMAAMAGVSLDEISFEDEKIMQLFTTNENAEAYCYGMFEFKSEFSEMVLHIAKPKNFMELAKVLGMMHGTDIWIGNMEYLLKHRVIDVSEAIGSREDIYTYLIDKGMDKELAYYITENVRKGKVSRGRVPEFWEQAKLAMKEYDVDKWFIASCEKISYLFPKAHAISYAMMVWREGYFKVYYPEIYDKVTGEYCEEHPELY